MIPERTNTAAYGRLENCTRCQEPWPIDLLDGEYDPETDTTPHVSCLFCYAGPLPYEYNGPRSSVIEALIPSN